MRDKAARETEEGGFPNHEVMGLEHGNGAGPSNLDTADLSGVIDRNDALGHVNVDGIEGIGTHHDFDTGDGAVMEAMDAVMGAGLNIDMSGDDGSMHLNRGVGVGVGVGGGMGMGMGRMGGTEGMEGLGVNHHHLHHPDLDVDLSHGLLGGEPSTLAELGNIDPHLRGIEGAGGMGGMDMKGKKRKSELDSSSLGGMMDERGLKLERK